MKRIKAGDTVVVISGDEKGKKGKVLSVSNTRVLVEGVNKMKKFVKKNALGKNQEGTMVEIERFFALSKVQLIDPKTGKGTRVSFVIKDGKKVRVSKKTKEVIVPVALEAEKPVEPKEKASVKSTKKESSAIEPKKTVKKKLVKSKAKKNEDA
jgi:large subunit ribosomal protein L24